MTKLRICLALLVVAAIGLPCLALGQESTAEQSEYDRSVADYRYYDWPCILGNYKEALGITDEQIARLESLRIQHQQRMDDLRYRLDTSRRDLDLMSARGGDLSALEARSRECDELYLQMRQAWLEHENARRAVFTDEQWREVSSMIGLGYGAGIGRGYARPYAGRGYGQGVYGRGYGRGYARPYTGRGYGRGYARAPGRGYGRGYYRGYRRPWSPRRNW